MTKQQPELLISVLIPTYNRPDSLKLVMEALKQQDLSHDVFEVILVDDASDQAVCDYQAEICNRLPFTLRYFRQNKTGPGAARNTALAHATADLVLFLDDDLIPEPGCLTAHVNFHSRQPDRAVCLMGAVKMHPSLNKREQARQHETEIPGTNEAPVWLDWYYYRTGNSSFKRGFLSPTPGFNTRMIAAEDTEFASRLHQQGLKLMFDPDIVVYHYHPMDVTGFMEKSKRYGESLAIWYRLAPAMRHLICHRYGIFARESKTGKKFKYILRALLINRISVRLLRRVAIVTRLFLPGISRVLLDHLHRFYLRRAFRKKIKVLTQVRMIKNFTPPDY